MGVRCAADPGTDCDAPPLLGAQNSVVPPAELVGCSSPRACQLARRPWMVPASTRSFRFSRPPFQGRGHGFESHPGY